MVSWQHAGGAVDSVVVLNELTQSSPTLPLIIMEVENYP